MFPKLKTIIYALTFFFALIFAHQTSASITIRPMLNTGLVGYWSFEEGSGTKVGDMSGRNKHGSLPSSGIATFTTPGLGSWTAPAGVASVQVEAWGGGGAGGSGGNRYGGGGGAYAKKNSYTVTPGNNYSFYVGNGSEDTYFIDISTVLAKKGSDGTAVGGQGGQASASIGDVKYSGGDGGGYGQLFDAYWGGDGGGGANGGGSGGGGEWIAYFPDDGGPAGTGSQPGGGGGGGCAEAGGTGAAGAPGQIVLIYTATTTTWVNGKRGNALEFSGSGDYASMGSVYNGVKTVAFWLKADNLTKKIMDLNGTANIEVSAGTITASNFTSPTIYVDGAVASTVNTDWHYVVITTGTGINASTIEVGRVGSGYFDGKIDEVRLYNRVLSAAEVASLYQSAKMTISHKAPTNAGLVGYWSFEEGAGTKAGDMSGRGKAGTIYSSTAETLTTPGAGSWTAPAGVTSVKVEAWGGGANGIDLIDVGGGGGAYSRKNNYPVTPGNNYAFYVGGSGQDSYFINSSTILAKGGSGATGGQASASIGDVKYSGGNAGGYGCPVNNCYAEGGGGGAGSGGNGSNGYDYGQGGAGGTPDGGAGGYGAVEDGGGGCSGGAGDGTAPGGGGGNDRNWCNDPGTGARGQIILTYPPEPSPNWINGKRGKAVDFDGTDDFASFGNVGSGIKTISFWINADDLTSRKVMDFDGTDQIEINGSSQITATSFPGTTAIYIDGAAASALTSGWHYVTITDTTGVNASAMKIGRVGSGYFDGKIDEVRVYNRVLSATEVAGLYQSSGKGGKLNSSQNNVVTTGLVGMWSFNGPDIAGSVAYDRSGQNNHGTISGAVPTIGKVGQGMRFNGSNSTMQIQDSTPLDLTNAVTMSAWFYPYSLNSGWYGIVRKESGSAVNYQLGHNGNKFLVTWYNGGWINHYTVNTYQPNRWYHLIGIIDSANDSVKIYVNGVLDIDNQTDANNMVANNGALNIGNIVYNNTYTNGIIDEVRIYNRALSASEIQRLYNMGR